MSTEYERRILDDIEKTGYPLEIDVLDLLLENGWLSVPQYTIYDEHTRKLRTLDVFAVCPIPKANKLARLILECKTSTGEKGKPWVFLQSRRLQQDIASLQQQKAIPLTDFSLIGMTILSFLHPYIDYQQALSSQIAPNVLESVQQTIQKIHFFNQNLPIAHSCHVAFRDGDEDKPSSFQKAIYQLRNASLELSSTPYHAPIFATVVFRGNLFELIKSGAQKNLRETEHVMFYTQHLQPYESEEGWVIPQTAQTIAPVVVDVVKDTYFKEYLLLLKKDLETLEKIYGILEKIKNE